jgi:hypothetical protein
MPVRLPVVMKVPLASGIVLILPVVATLDTFEAPLLSPLLRVRIGASTPSLTRRIADVVCKSPELPNFTSLPESVAPFPPVLAPAASAVATPVPSPLIPVLTGNPVQLVSVPLAGVPSKGVTSVGDVANTKAPLPVSPVTVAARFALLGVPRKVRTPVPVVVVDGEPPAPPPITKALVASTPELAQVDALEK